MTTETMLPAQFADLERFAPVWALPDANDRYERRKASTMTELQDFYDAMVAGAKDAMAYLDQFDLYNMPDEANNLFWMLAALSPVGFAVDAFHQPTVPDSNRSRLDWVVCPGP